MLNVALAVAFFVMILAPCAIALLSGRRRDDAGEGEELVAPAAIEFEDAASYASDAGYGEPAFHESGYDGPVYEAPAHEVPAFAPARFAQVQGSMGSLVEVAEAEELVARAMAAQANAAALAASARVATVKAHAAAEAADRSRRVAEEAVRHANSARAAERDQEYYDSQRGTGDSRARVANRAA